MVAARLRVLLVEDDLVSARIMIRTLQRVPSPSFDVVHEGTLTEALRQLTSGERFDVAILDLNLPDSLGIQTLARLQEADPDLPIVVMTGDSDPAIAELALEVGAQDYLVKGESGENTVARAIRYAISRKHADLDRKAISDRLNASLAAENKRLDEETALARAMQFGLLPNRERLDQYRQSRGLAVDAFFEPSSEIGGDLWGCTEADGLRTIFFMFDFSGHGVGAALNVFRLHALLSQLGRQIIDPAATLNRLNEMLVGLLPRGQYATVFLGVVDTAAATLTWSAGGAPPPILFSAAGGHAMLDTKGKPLGISPRAHYSNRVASFPEGSCLFLYSDAMTESRVAGGKMLGEERMASMVKRFAAPGGIDIEGLIARFYDTVKRPLDDDLTAISIAHLAAPVAAQPVHSQSSAPLLLTSRRLEVVDVGLAPPYSGFIEIGAQGVSDVNPACLEAAEQGGLCLSLSVAGAWACCAANLLGNAVSRRFGGNRDWVAVEHCLSEAITNAMIHGGLGVKSALRETPEGLAAYARAIQEGLSDPVRATKRVEVTVVPLPGDDVQITVYDRGEGYDFDAMFNLKAVPDAKHGRGLTVIRKVAKSVDSRDGGRTLVMIV
jgi:sigma-B regulation protein RsbU (phosphoserine phosphatase)